MLQVEWNVKSSMWQVVCILYILKMHIHCRQLVLVKTWYSWPAGTNKYAWNWVFYAYVWTHCVHMCAIDMYVCYAHIYFGHVHMHAICHALYCHVFKVIHILGGFHITAYVESCTCYMPKLLHMPMIGVAASQNYVCYMFMLHWHCVLNGVGSMIVACVQLLGQYIRCAAFGFGMCIFWP